MKNLSQYVDDVIESINWTILQKQTAATRTPIKRPTDKKYARKTRVNNDNSVNILLKGLSFHF